MYEAERKYRLPAGGRPAILTALARLGGRFLERIVCRDVYYDAPGGVLAAADRELRLRRIESPGGGRCLVTFKDAPFDKASRSKPEWETEVLAPEAAAAILAGLGFEERLRLVKECENWELERNGRRFLATLARVAGLDGEFLEVEALDSGSEEAVRALEEIAALARELGLGENDHWPAYYTEMLLGVGRGPGVAAPEAP